MRALAGSQACWCLSPNWKVAVKFEKNDVRPFASQIINFYMQLIADRAGKGGLASAHPMTTFFYPKLLQAGYAGVRRWTRRVDIFAHDIVLVPVHLGQHWCFAVSARCDVVVLAAPCRSILCDSSLTADQHEGQEGLLLRFDGEPEQ